MGFIPDNGKGGRPRVAGPIEVARRLVEDNVCVILAPHFRVLGYEPIVEGDEIVLQKIVDPETGEFVGGAKLYGESRDGIIEMSGFENLAAQMDSVEKLLNRTHGRPKQVTEITGEGGGPVAVTSDFDLSNLSNDEKRALLALAKKAQPKKAPSG